MSTDIACPNCGSPIQVDAVIKQQLQQTVVRELNEQHAQQLEKIKAQTKANARKQAIEAVRAEYDAKIKATKEAAAEQVASNQKLQEELTQLLREQRKLKSEKDQLKLEYEKKLLADEQKLKEQAKKEALEESRLELAKRDKQLSDLEKQLEIAQRKAQQGSQQLQGEVLEVELESELTQAFPYDEISEVPKGIRGADIVQSVLTRRGSRCGTIVWELKNTRNWSAKWLAKIKADQRALKCEVAIIITTTLPDEIETFGQLDGVWITTLKYALPLASALRQQLVSMQSLRQAQKGRSDNAQVVYDYLISNEFRQRIEVWLEYFAKKDEQLRKEERYFRKKWSQERAELSMLTHNTAGIYGDLQGLIGSAMPKIASLELPEEIDD